MLIGVDAGTSVVKAVGFDFDGNILATAELPIATRSSEPGLAEQDFEEILRAVGETIRHVVADRSDGVEILAITAQGDGLWLLDQDGHPVRPGMLWSDGRASAIVEHWMADGTAEEAFRRNGNVPFAGSAAALLRHLERHEPDALMRSATAGYCKDAIGQRLTGVRATDASDASLPFLDLSTREYDLQLLELFGVSRWRHLLPPVDPSPGIVRTLTADGSRIVGLPVGIPVHAGTFDFPATTTGAGLIRPGSGLIAFGTTLACGVLVDRVDTSGTPSGMTICLPTDGRWIRLLPAMAGTLALDWVLPLIAATHDDLEALLSESSPGAGGVQMLPYLAASGERAPFVDPSARGRLIGLNLATTRSAIARAVCEGIAYAARHCFEAGGLAPDGAVLLCGGGARTPGLRQILADVLGRPVLIARQPETGARGAVIAALQPAGMPVDLESWTRPDGEILPNSCASELYERGYRSYLDQIERARGAWSGPAR